MDLEQLEVLESRIEEIVSRHVSVLQERDRLSERLEEAEAEMKQIAARLKSYEKERSVVKSRVERIMSRLEGAGLD